MMAVVPNVSTMEAVVAASVLIKVGLYSANHYQEYAAWYVILIY